MIAWQNATAFWGLLLLGAPIVIHLLRRHRAHRVQFPSLRFVRTAQASASRFRRLSDPLLLALRLGVIALAVSAAARPIVLTSSRLARWNASTARALVIDTSPSMRDGVDRVREASDAADAEAKTAAYSKRFDVPVLADGIARAAAWLSSTPPSRKEIVVISDVQLGAIDAESVAGVPESVGIRIVPIGAAVAARRIDGPPLMDPVGPASHVQMVDLTSESTAVTIERRSDAGRLGIRIIPEAAADRLLRVAARAGTAAGARSQRIAIRLLGADPAPPSLSSLEPIRAGWMLRTVLRLQETLASMRDLAANSRGLDRVTAHPWTVLLADDGGRTIVASAAAGDELVVDVAAPSDSLLAAAVVRAALNARVDVDGYREMEIARSEPALLDALKRPAGPVDAGAWRSADVTDARWCWLLALGFLLAELWLRRRSSATGDGRLARAA
jgi:hypothetical protein